MDIQLDMQGLEALTAKLQTLKQETRYKGGRFAGRKAANVIANAAKAKAAQIDDPKTAENIMKNIAVRFNNRLFKKTGDIGFRIGIRGGAKTTIKKGKDGKKTNPNNANPGKDTWYWRLVEFGTVKTAAKPFMRPALQESTQAAVNTFISEYQKAIDRAIKRAAISGGTA